MYVVYLPDIEYPVHWLVELFSERKTQEIVRQGTIFHLCLRNFGHSLSNDGQGHYRINAKISKKSPWNINIRT